MLRRHRGVARRDRSAATAGQDPRRHLTWEDYAEHDGVDEPRLHAQRITLTKTADRLVLDLTGTSPQAKGPINHAGDYAGRQLPEVAGPHPAQPGRDARAHGRAGRQRGRGRAHRHPLPAAGDAGDAGVPGADQRPHVRDPAAAGRAGRGHRQGGGRLHARRPGDDPLHRHLRPRRRGPLVHREILGGGSKSPAPTAATPSTWCPSPATCRSSSWRTGSRCGSRPWPWPPTRGAPGPSRAAGLPGDRALHPATFMSVADRSILSCWGVRAAGPVRRSGSPSTPAAAPAGDAGPVRRGAGGRRRGHPHRDHRWQRVGRPPDQDPAAVALDVAQGKVSRGRQAGLRRGAGGCPRHRRGGHRHPAGQLAAERGEPPMFDRGPGTTPAVGGAARADVDT